MNKNSFIDKGADKKRGKKAGKVVGGIFGIFIALIVIVFVVVYVSNDSDTPSGSVGKQATESQNEQQASSKALLVDREGIKVSVDGTKSSAELFGAGEGLVLLVENASEKDVIISVSDLSINGTMKTVIQPQMPLNITTKGKSSTQTFVIPDVKLEGAKAELKLHVLDSNCKELFATEAISISL